jgi:hypothetical protein
VIDSTDSYKAKITGDSRRILLKAIIDIISPDIVYGTVENSGAADWSKSAQLYDKEMESDSRYATLERGRWLLDGTFRIIPDDPQELTGQVGFVGDVLSGDDGTFPQPVWVEEQFSNVSILQACTIYFPENSFDGIPVDFTVEVKQGGTSYYTETVTGNTESSATFSGFTVYNPDAIRLTVTKWSLPGRRLRVSEIIPGVYETWDESILASFEVVQQGNVSCLSLPYGTCTLRMDNLDRRFEPRSKTGVFQSIEERQGIDVSIGVQLDDGSSEYKRVGIYYQYSGGWTTGDNGLTMEWNLCDIIGLLVDREFIVPSTLPTTLNGWLAALVGQLGTNFESLYHADPDYGILSVTATSKDAVTGKKCGDILMWACQATGTWPRADAETGYLTAEPMWNQGNKLDLDNMVSYPTMKANNSVGALIFNTSGGTQYVITGNSESASETKTINNPFIHTQAQALTAARMILSTYGGNQLETTGRGDPTSEIGDVDTVWLNESSATTGRRTYQTFSISNGVLQNCKSRLLQADGSFMFQSCELITKSGTWTAPAGVSQLRVVIGQGGQGGMHGQGGTLRAISDAQNNWQGATFEASVGSVGDSGIGGKIWYGTIGINEQQEFDVSIGKGGAASSAYGTQGAYGGETTFGVYSSANGKVYELGYTDISNGDSYGRTGVSIPRNGTSDGAAGGAGGSAGAGVWEQDVIGSSPSGVPWYRTSFKVTVEPGEGYPARSGADGFVLVFWDKEEN